MKGRCLGHVRVRGSRGDYPYDEGKHLIVAVQFAYGDDSGTHQGPNGATHCLVAGYVASPRQWKLFRRDWRDALGNVEEFHAVEFFQRRKSSGSPYRDWTDEQARMFLARLCVIIDKYALAPIGGAVKVSDFFAYSVEERRLLTGAVVLTNTHWHQGEFEVTQKTLEHMGSPNRPYFIVFPGFFVEAMLRSGDDQIHLVFDSQGDAEAHAKEHYDRFRKFAPGAERLSSITFASSKDELPLQAADLYAYTWHAKLSGRQLPPDLEMAFRVLTKKKPVVVVQGKDYLDKLLGSIRADQEAKIEAGRNERAE